MVKDASRYILLACVFLVPFIPLLVSDSMFFPYITGKNFAFRILVEVGLAAWVLLALYDSNYRPRFSWIAVFGAALLLIMFFADLFGEYAPKSFWSNFERMDGYVTLVHFYFYFLLLGSVLRTPKLWRYFLYTSLAVASGVAWYGLGQSLDWFQNSGSRVDSTLGNAAYMAVYMLFHIFFLAYLFVDCRSWLTRSLYGVMGLLFTYILLATGTRGTFIGLAFGATVTVVYLALFGRRYPEVRKVAFGGLALMIVVTGLFFAFKDSAFVQQNASLNRIASISIEKDLVVRTTIWGMAFEGFQERPLLGWGQGGFNYVFNKYYEPSLYAQEQWFDRVHNIFFDWLIAGGISGFVAYFGILFSALYYLFWRPLFNQDESFTVLERAVLLGLLAGYFTHNLVVFDNIVSYIFYAVILALIHHRVSTEVPALSKLNFNRDTITTMVTPVTAVMLAITIYMVNIPSILASKDIINAMRADNVASLFFSFQKAIDRDSFADQEILEQLASRGASVLGSEKIDGGDRLVYKTMIESEFTKLIDKKPDDARLHVLFANYYRAIDQPVAALDQLEIASRLSPKKQQIKISQGFSYIQMDKGKQSLPYFKSAYELDNSFDLALVYYAVGALYASEDALFEDLLGREVLENDKGLQKLVFTNDVIVQALYDNQNFPMLIYVLEGRVAVLPEDAQSRVSLALAYHQSGQKTKAISIIKQAIVDIPSFTDQGQEIIKQLEAGTV